MAQVGRARLLPVLCGTREFRHLGNVSREADSTVASEYSTAQPEVSLLETFSAMGATLDSKTASTTSLAGATLCRYSSAIRAVCANERQYGSVRGVAGKCYPYRDPWTCGMANKLLEGLPQSSANHVASFSRREINRTNSLQIICRHGGAK